MNIFPSFGVLVHGTHKVLQAFQIHHVISQPPTEGQSLFTEICGVKSWVELHLNYVASFTSDDKLIILK